MEFSGCDGPVSALSFSRIGAVMPLRAQDYFRQSVVTHCSFAGTITITNSTSILVSNSVVYTRAASAIVLQGDRNKLVGNLAVSLALPPTECVRGACVDACTSSPCQHGGSCIGLLESSYACVCPADWTGTHCELIAVGMRVPGWQISQANCSIAGACIDRDPCQPNQCQHGGVCRADSTADVGFNCYCTAGFRGLYCTVAIAVDPATYVIEGEDNGVRDNVAAGSARVGFRLPAVDACEAAPTYALFRNNIAHSNLIGLHIIVTSTKIACVKVNKFTAYMNWDIGIYGNVRPSIRLSDVFVSGSKVGILINSFGPDSAQHLIEHKAVRLFDSIIVGLPEGTPCTRLSAPPSLSFRSFSASSPRRGLVLSSFSQHPVQPAHQFMDVTSYPAVSGRMIVVNVTFVDFGESDSCSNGSFALASNPFLSVTHAHQIFNSTFVRVSDEALIYVHNSTKHAVIEIDSTSLSTTVVPFAHAAKSPSRVIVHQPYSNCQAATAWNAHQCTESSPERTRILVVESMDADSETRAIGPLSISSNGVDADSESPVAVMANGNSKTISTFYPLVRAGTKYNLTFFGAPPFHMRFHFLQSVSGEGILLAIGFPNVSERLDVYVDGGLVPSAALLTSYDTDGRLLTQRRHNLSYGPALNAPVGTNFHHAATDTLHLAVSTASAIEILMALVLRASFEFKVPGELKLAELTSRLANTLSLDPEGVLITDAVTIRSTRTGKRRLQERLERVVAEIGLPAATSRTSGDLLSPDIVAAQMEFLIQLATTLVALAQSGGLAAALGVSELVAFQLVMPSGLDRLTPVATAGTFMIQMPARMGISRQPPLRLARGENFTTAVTVVDDYANPCVVLGFPTSWVATVFLHQTDDWNTTTELIGQVNASFQSGVATFRDLRINVSAENYFLEFRADSGGFVAISRVFGVGAAPPLPPKPPMDYLMFWLVSIAVVGLACWVFYWFYYRSAGVTVEPIVDRIPTPDQHFLPLPRSFIGVPLGELFAMDPTTRCTKLPTKEQPAKLIVIVHAARDLKRMDGFGLGKSDPFAVVELDNGQLQTTRVIANNLNPIWEESFEFVVQDEDEDLIVNLYDEDKNSSEIMGEVKVTINSLTPFETEPRWFQLRRSRALQRPGKKVQGYVKLSCKYEPRLDQPRKVPHVLLQMCSTLEREALHAIGVFRLPSDTAKMSMEALEQQHAVHTRLSTLCYVEDPMALSSLLLYTLASMPDPVFSPSEPHYMAAYQLGLPLLGLSHRSADARWATCHKPMIALIDSLERTHFLVFIRILEMLERFAAAATINLMTAKNLSNVFAPVLWRQPKLPSPPNGTANTGRSKARRRQRPPVAGFSPAKHEAGEIAPKRADASPPTPQAEEKPAGMAPLVALLHLLIEQGTRTIAKEGRRRLNGKKKPREASLAPVTQH